MITAAGNLPWKPAFVHPILIAFGHKLVRPRHYYLHWLAAMDKFEKRFSVNYSGGQQFYQAVQKAQLQVKPLKNQVMKKTLQLLSAAFLAAFSLQVQVASGQFIASGSNSNASFFSCTNPGWAQGTGANNTGQLGDGSLVNKNLPVPIGGSSDIIAVSSGPTHTLYLKADGTVYASGENTYGQLGDVSFPNSSTLVQVPYYGGMLTDIKAIAAGANFSLFLKNDGTVFACGYAADGQLGTGRNDIPGGPRPVLKEAVYQTFLSNVIAIAAGSNHSMFLVDEGNNTFKVYACGSNANGQLGFSDTTILTKNLPDLVSFASPNIKGIAAGDKFSLFLVGDTAWACGTNGFGQLGINSLVNQRRPQMVIGAGNVGFLTGIKSITAGSAHAVYLKNDGTAWSCGKNTGGCLGDNSVVNRSTPVQVRNFTDGKSIAAGASHTLFLKNDGSFWACGRNTSGQLGDGTTTNRTTATQVKKLTLFPTITGGPVFSGSGRLFAGEFLHYNWSTGSNLPSTTVNTSGTYAVTVTDLYGCTGSTSQKVNVNAQGIAAGSYSFSSHFWCNTPGQPFATGGNFAGNLGDGTNTDKNTVTPLPGLTNIQSISGSIYHTLFLKSDSTVWASGQNFDGQLGNSTNISSSTPVQVTGLTGATAVAAGSDHSLFLKDNGTVRACGSNEYGQLGDGTNTGRNITMMVPALSGITAIAAGSDHSLFLKNDGTVWACGRNEWGQLGNGNFINQATPVQVSGLTGIIAIAAGSVHSLFLKNDGTVWACGAGDRGALGNGCCDEAHKNLPVQVVGLTGIMDISAGGSHSLFLKNDGTVWACGENLNGQAGVGGLGAGAFIWNATQVRDINNSGVLNNVVAIEAGNEHSLFLKNDGRVASCGSNGSGQLGDGTNTNKDWPVEVLIQPSIPTLSATKNPLNKGCSTTLSITAGDLRGATAWKWYTSSCGGTLVGTGTSIIVSPTATTTYYVRGDGGCQAGGACASITVTVNEVATIIPSVIAATKNPVCKGSATTLSIGTGSLGDATAWKWYSGSCGGTLVGTGNSITVSPTSNTTYYVRGEGGCFTPGPCASILVTVEALPNITISPVTDTICVAGTYKNLTAVGANTYTWTPFTGLTPLAGEIGYYPPVTGPVVRASPTTTTTYTVTGTSANGCVSTKNVKIVVKPVPSTLSNTSITSNSAVNRWSFISCATGYTLQYKVSTSTSWTNTLQINTNTNSATTAGLLPNTNYTWRVRTKFSDGTTSGYSANKSFKTLAATGTVEALRSVEVTADDQYNVYPNPATGQLMVTFESDQAQAFTLKMTDVTGRTVESVSGKSNAGKNQVPVNVSSWVPGTYLFILQNGNTLKTAKVIKQ